MTDQPPVDLASVLANLLQQQTAMLQQQAVLLQAHVESNRFQRLLIERLLGAGLATDMSAPTPSGNPRLHMEQRRWSACHHQRNCPRHPLHKRRQRFLSSDRSPVADPPRKFRRRQA
jgi:hypothetical protein